MVTGNPTVLASCQLHIHVTVQVSNRCRRCSQNLEKKKKPHCNVFYEKKGKKITCRLGPYHIEIVGSLSLITAVIHIFFKHIQSICIYVCKINSHSITASYEIILLSVLLATLP